VSEGNQVEELAAQAAEAVRRTVAEAEAKAEQLVRDAEAEAKRVREAAEANATEIRERAEAEARERIESTSRALEELRGKLGAAPDPKTPPTEVSPPPEGAEPEPEPVRAEPEVPTAPPSAGVSGPGGNGDDAAARLVAMKLAVDGKGREEIEAELTQRFGSGDRSALLDDVLARAGR
jgi:hypothetical protein